MKQTMAFIVATFALTFSLMAGAGTALTSTSQSTPAAVSQPFTEETCDAARAEALHRCAHYTDAGRDRCDARAEKAYEKCLKRIKKPKG